MTTYTAVTAGERDADSPVNVGLIGKLIDNPIAITEGATGAPKIQSAALDSNIVTNAKMADDSVGTAEIISGAIKQAELSSSLSATSSITDSENNSLVFTATGGTYIIGWEGYGSGASVEMSLSLGNYNPKSANQNDCATSFAAQYSLELYTNSSKTAYVRHRYITASPPYKIGSTDYPYFLYALINKDNVIRSINLAHDPSWAYNGPYKCAAECYSKNENGRTVGFINMQDIPPEIEALKETDPKTYLKEKKKISKRMVELTPELKNRNMPYCPCPFVPKQGERVLMIAPDDDIMEFLIDVHEDDDLSVHDLFLDDYLRLDEEITLAEQPPGVSIVKAKFK